MPDETLQHVTNMDDNSTTARATPDDQDILRDREASRLVDPVTGEAPNVAPDVSSDVGATFPRETIEGPREPFDADRPYFPPTDPVLKPNPTSDQGLDVLGGMEPTSMDDVGLEGGAGVGLMPGDDQIHAAVVRELREDAMTTDLDLRVDVREGTVYLRGRVPTLDDSEAALEVASRVEGVGNVKDMIEVEGLTDR